MEGTQVLQGAPSGLQGVKPVEVNIPCQKVTVEFNFKTFKDVDIPVWLKTEDAVKQYVGIWKIFLSIVLATGAKKVLEFGTREGYSTKMFSEFLRYTDGHLTSVDLAPHKIAPDDLKTMDNVTFVQKNVLELDWQEPVDILYIDDWHNSFHLYEELDRFAKFARVILVHDVCQDWQVSTGIMNGLINWAQANFMPYAVYPFNSCGLAVIEVEKYRNYYK